MPTYTYRCGNCDHHFDLIQRFNDPDPTICPTCGFKNDLKRVYKPVGVVFKGSGFYATDNKSSSILSSNGNKPAANGSSGDSTASPSKDAPKSEPSAPAKTEKSD